MVKIEGVGNEKLKVSPAPGVTGSYYGMETEDERYKREEALRQMDKETLRHIETAKDLGVSTHRLLQIEKENKARSDEYQAKGMGFQQILDEKTRGPVDSAEKK